MNNRNKEIRDLVFGAILMAMVILFSLLYFYQVIGFAAFTVAHVPVLIGAIMLGKKYGAFLGFIFGLVSLIFAFSSGGTNAPFNNPLLSVVPRVFFGWIIYYIYIFFTKYIKKRIIAVGLTMAISTLIHSLIVLPILYIVAKNGFYFYASENPITINQNVIPFIIGILGSNAIIEIVIAVCVGTPIVLVMDNLINKQAD